MKNKTTNIMNKTNLKFSVGAVAHNDKAPRDKASRWYRVTSSGVCDWISSGPTRVAVDDMIYAYYSGGSIYKYTHHVSPLANKEDVSASLALLATKEEINKVAKEVIFGEDKGYQLFGGTLRPHACINFVDGKAPIMEGDVLEGATSGNSHIVRSVEITTGSWEDGDAEGIITLVSASGYLSSPFTKEEDLLTSVEEEPVEGGDLVVAATLTDDNPFVTWVFVKDSVGIVGCELELEGGTLKFKPASGDIIAIILSIEGSNSLLVSATGGEEAVITCYSLVADTTTGVVTRSGVDLDDLANCEDECIIHFLGVILR